MKFRPLMHFAYLATIALKGVDGIAETMLGTLIAVTGQDRFYSLVLHFTTPELESDIGSRTMAVVQHGAAGLAHASARFVIFYLLTHGILKAAIAVNLLQGKRWAFVPASVILAGFVLYMSYHLTHHFSGWLLGFALFDLLTLALVVNEWLGPRRQVFG